MNYNIGLSEAISRVGVVRTRRHQRMSGGRVGASLKLNPLLKSATSIEHPGIARSVRYLVKHFRDPIRVTHLTAVAKLSRRGFLKSFRKHTGRAPGEVLRLMRIEHAKRLLVEHDFSLAVVAVASGFRKANSFCVAFRSVTGVPPMEFRRQAEPGIHDGDRI